jgi:hypothetical protein
VQGVLGVGVFARRSRIGGVTSPCWRNQRPCDDHPGWPLGRPTRPSFRVGTFNVALLVAYSRVRARIEGVWRHPYTMLYAKTRQTRRVLWAGSRRRRHPPPSR